MANTTNWLSISSQSGSSGQTILTLSANKNLSAGTKTAEVTAYNPVYNISAKTYVTIDAYSPYIYVSDSIIGIPASGGTYQLGIESNCSFVIAYPNMVSTYSTSAGTGNISVTFSVPATYQSQTITENIVITDESGQYSIVVRLEQYGSEPEISAVPPELLFEANGGTLYFTVSANCVYHINNSTISGWCGVSPQSGYTGSTTFTVTTTANTGDSAKTGIIAVVGPGTAGDMVQVRQKRSTVQIPYTADTSTIEASGETRTITIDTTGLVDSSITVDIQNAPGATYTYSNGVITLTIPDNAGLQRDIVVSVTGKTTGGDDAATSITFTQAEHTTVQIPYTADTSTVDASGETRTITIDTTGLIASSITIGVEGATGVTCTYNNGVVTVVFPDNSGSSRNITVNVTGQTVNGDNAVAAITYNQENDLKKNYLTFNINSGGTINWVSTDLYHKPVEHFKTIQYSLNDGPWVSITSSSAGTTFNVAAGDIVRFRGDNDTYTVTGNVHTIAMFCGTTATFSLEGNIMSLFNSTDYSHSSAFAKSYALEGMFSGCTGLISAENLVLPATTLTNDCYFRMFENCTSLTTAPELPATTMMNGCYNSMFKNCSSLTAAPELPATTLAYSCYFVMFKNCSSLTTVQATLPATTLAEQCYMGMYEGCRNLASAPELPATTLAKSCYSAMFDGCYNLVRAPELPANILVEYCYNDMFFNCISLNYIKCLATDISANNCLSDWVAAVPSYNGTFVKNPNMSSWPRGRNGIPSGWTVQNAT